MTGIKGNIFPTLLSAISQLVICNCQESVVCFDRKHPLFLLESTSYVDVEKFILVPDLDTLKGHQTCFAENVSINQILYKYE